MKTKISIRNAVEKDAERLLSIYSYYVENTAVSFEWESPTLEEFSERITDVRRKFPYLVAEITEENQTEPKIIGYAYAHTFRTRTAFNWDVESSIYIDKDYRQGGVGKKLLVELEKQLKAQNIQNIYACIAYIQKEDEYLNHDSVRFHEKMDYKKVGEFSKCGYKFNRWYNLVVMEKILGNHPVEENPIKISGSYKLIGDGYEGFYSCGLSMLKNESIGRSHEKISDVNQTQLESSDGILLKINHHKNEKTGAILVQTEIANNSEKEVTLEMLTSFVLPDIKADKIYRLESFWSAEGRVKIDSIEDLNLERSWNKMAIRVEKFGNVGSMPVRRYFPFVALEDSASHTFTAVQLYTPASWQIELFCQNNQELTVSGGIADRDFGHWTKKLSPNEHFIAPKAIVARGRSLEEVCDALVKTQSPDVSTIDNEMGIIFNEYCTTWGNPSMENLKRIVDKLCEKAQGKIQYLVMDSGWYLNEGEWWWEHIGNWTVNKKRFPNGLKELTDYIRSKGMIPGIWFEFESVCNKCSLFNDKDHLVKKDGVPLTVANRRFLDMEDPWVINHLSEKVINLLKENGFGYIKVDYNDTMGIGCDGNESFGENLRKKLIATQSFFKKMKEEIPDLVIENCSSGGHRLEPSFMELSSMASFSDAHEIAALPIIAANVLRVIPSSQNQVWAVMRKDDSPARIFYSLCSTFTGRMGLSGDIYDLSDQQWDLLNNGICFYKKVSDIIKLGKIEIQKTNAISYNKPMGEQLVVKTHTDKALVIYHRFAESRPIDEAVSDWIPDFKSIDYKILDTYGLADRDFSAQAWLLQL